MHPALFCFCTHRVGLFAPLYSFPHHPFLSDTSDQFARAVEDASAVETPPATAPWGIGGVEQPFVGAGGAMEPDRMIQAGTDEFAPHPAKPVGQRAGPQQGIVTRVGDNRTMQCRVLKDRRQIGDGTEPGMRSGRARIAVHPVQLIDRAHVDRARAQDERSLLFAHSVSGTLDHGAAHFLIALEFFGRCNIRHGHIVMRQAVLRSLETRGEVQDSPLLASIICLTGNDAPIGKTASIEVARGMICDIHALLPTTKEVGVQRMCFQPIGCGRLRGLQGLTNDLTAKYTPDPASLLWGGKGVLAIAGHSQQADELCDQLFRGLFFAHASGFAEGLRIRQAPDLSASHLPERKVLRQTR